MRMPSHSMFVQTRAVRRSLSQRLFNINIRQEETEENKNRWRLQKHCESILARWTVDLILAMFSRPCRQREIEEVLKQGFFFFLAAALMTALFAKRPLLINWEIIAFFFCKAAETGADRYKQVLLML